MKMFHVEHSQGFAGGLIAACGPEQIVPRGTNQIYRGSNVSKIS
jgi:hypothetical protein